MDNRRIFLWLVLGLFCLAILLFGGLLFKKIRKRLFPPPLPRSVRHVDSVYLSYSEVARPADSFVESVGLVSENTSRDRSDFFSALLVPAITDLGIRHLRSSIPLAPDDPHVADIRALAQRGCRTLVISKLKHVRSGDPLTDPITEAPATVRDVVKAAGGAIEGVEGPNEYGNKNSDPDWPVALHNYCSVLYKTLKADPETRPVPIVGPTLYSKERRDLGDFNALCDIGNVHIYDFPFPSPRNTYWKPILEGQISHYAHKPYYLTETGFNTGHNPYTSVTEAEKTKYLPRQLLRFIGKGFQRVYIYQLRDVGTDPNDQETNLGLLHFDGSKKPAYYVLRNLLHLLAEPGAKFRPDLLRYEIEGRAEALQHLLLQKSNHDYYLLLWENTDSTLPEEQHPVTVRFKRPVAAIALCPLIGNERPRFLAANAAGLRVSVSDMPIVLRITPALRGRH